MLGEKERSPGTKEKKKRKSTTVQPPKKREENQTGKNRGEREGEKGK